MEGGYNQKEEVLDRNEQKDEHVYPNKLKNGYVACCKRFFACSMVILF